MTARDISIAIATAYPTCVVAAYEESMLAMGEGLATLIA